jgi:hypothetical protein
MKNGDKVKLVTSMTSDEGRTLPIGTEGWIIDVQGGGRGFVIEIPLEDADDPFDTLYVDAAQIEVVEA